MCPSAPELVRLQRLAYTVHAKEKSMLTVRSLVVLASILSASPVSAADLKVTSAGAVRGLIAQIIDDYSRQTGQRFEFTVGTTGQLRAIIGSGFPADLVITSAPLMAELEKT